MAKQIGIIALKGTINGVNYYSSKGKAFMRKSGGGFKSEAIKKDPNMVRVRETYAEFGNTSKVKKIFRTTLLPFFGNQKDETLHGRMMQLFLQIKDCDLTSERGKRQVGLGLLTAEGQQLLTSFEFTPHPLVLSTGVYDASSFTYGVTALDPSDLRYRNGATHLELRLGVLVFDFEELQATLFSSVPLVLAKAMPPTHFSLAPTTTPSGAGIRITVLGYRYLQELNGRFYPLKDKMVYGLKVLEITN